MVQVLVRELQGGASRGMSRCLEVLVPRGAALVACSWDEVDVLRDVRSTNVSPGVVPEQAAQEVGSVKRSKWDWADRENRITHRSNIFRSTSSHSGTAGIVRTGTNAICA